LSIWAAREGAWCDGYEYEADILEGCKLVAEAFGVGERCTWHQADFNKKEDTEKIGTDYDVCTCLSVMNWVHNKGNLIDLLSRQKIVLYEGHDNDEVETGRLRQAGFAAIRKVAVSERNRGIFLVTKSAQPQVAEITWDEFENRYGLKGAPYHIPRVTTGDGSLRERVYFKTEVWKVRLSSEKNPAKLASPYEETKFIKKLEGVPHVCRFKEYIEKPDHTVVVLEHFPNVGTLDQVAIPREFRSKVEDQKHSLIKAINEAGVLHNDLYDRNFLVDHQYNLCLIDFDQAQCAEGRNDYDHGYYYRVPRQEGKTGKVAGNGNGSKIMLLERGWDIAARSNASYPGKYIAYYSLEFEGREFAGERPWDARWG
jgi:hypothetical protein